MGNVARLTSVRDGQQKEDEDRGQHQGVELSFHMEVREHAHRHGREEKQSEKDGKEEPAAVHQAQLDPQSAVVLLSPRERGPRAVQDRGPLSGRWREHGGIAVFVPGRVDWVGIGIRFEDQSTK